MSTFEEGVRKPSSLWEEAVEAEKWFEVEREKLNIKTPNGFEGMKTLILKLVTTGKNDGMNPKEIAEAYLFQMEKSITKTYEV